MRESPFIRNEEELKNHALTKDGFNATYFAAKLPLTFIWSTNSFFKN